MVRRFLPIVAIASLVACGCLSGSYDADFRASLERYREEGAFYRLQPTPHVLADRRLTLRVPKLFQSEDLVGDQERSKPPFLKDFPGFRAAFESLIAADGGQAPVVLSVGVVTDKESGVDDLKKKILAQVQKEPSFAKQTWATAEGQAAGGGGVAWSILNLEGSQPFDRVNNGVTEKKNAEGATQIWVASDPDAKVSVALVWRVPKDVMASVPLDELADLVSRTVEFNAPAAPAEPPPAAAPPAAAR